ncbi:DUF4998 domain-containing protein [Limibacterium fermenti]|uniref:DUF4998 domain-containing protein n=1 Tax=Limibacterium fermenti TaxID=3229863 RepID=UPI003A60015D
MTKYIFRVGTLLFLFLIIGCDNANDLLNQYIKDGPIVYAARVNELNTQSGYYRFRVNIYPAEDVNRSYCVLNWNMTEGSKDSVKIDYNPNYFDDKQGCYYAFIDIPPSAGIQGNLEIHAQNVDIFGNRSLIETGSAYIYGESYVSSLINAQIRISAAADEVIFEPRIGAVGNLLSYEQNNGHFTEEVFVTEDSHTLINAKAGGIVRTKTRYLINESDIDTLNVTRYLETKIPQVP